MRNVKNLFGMAVMATALVACSSNDDLTSNGHEGTRQVKPMLRSESICRQLLVLVQTIPSQVHLHLMEVLLRSTR